MSLYDDNVHTVAGILFSYCPCDRMPGPIKMLFDAASERGAPMCGDVCIHYIEEGLKAMFPEVKP